jgi:hypothetical protein
VLCHEPPVPGLEDEEREEELRRRAEGLCFGETCGREADAGVDVEVETEVEAVLAASAPVRGGGTVGAASPWVGEDASEEIRGA